MAKKTSPRRVPSRDEKYMGLAFWYASFSKDPATQIGAVIVNEDNHQLGQGYNGMPSQYNDNEEDWGRPAKYLHIIHSEINAINHCLERQMLSGSIIYITAPPCPTCMLEIVNAKISEVIYFDCIKKQGSMINDDEFSKTKEVATKGMVKLSKFSGNLNWMRDRIQLMESVGIFD